MKPAKLLFTLAIVSGATLLGQLHGQTVQYIVIGKTLEHGQTSETSAEPYMMHAWRFGSWISGSSLTSGYPTGTNSIVAPGPTTINYEFITGDAEWKLVGQSGFMYGDQATLDAMHPNGTYSLTIGGLTSTLNLSGNAYANRPILTFSAGTWSGGTLYLTPAEAAAGFTVSTSTTPFTGWVNDGTCRIGLYGSGDGFNGSTETFTASTISLNVSAGALVSGRTYSFEAEHNKVVSADQTAFDSLSGSPDAIAVYSMLTNVTVQVVPEPSTYAFVAGIGALLGAVVWRRRCGHSSPSK